MNTSLALQNPTLESIIEKEWLLTNGIGGFASSTILGLNTRKYHGLLIASFNPPTDRFNCVSKIDETVSVNNESVHIHTNQYPKTTSPEGYQNISTFERSPLPKTTFKHELFRLEKTIFMHQNHNTTIVEYKNTGSSSLTLHLRPHLFYRNYHHTQKYKEGFLTSTYNKDSSTLTTSNQTDKNLVYLKHTSGIFKNDPIPFLQNQYKIEKERGQDFSEDTFTPGLLSIDLSPNESTFVILTTEKQETNTSPTEIKREEIEYFLQLAPKKTPQFTSDLIRSFNQFIVKRKSTNSDTILAGYPWFTDWGRDSMIALRGAIIPLQKWDVLKSIISTFYKSVNQGILPNRFPDYPGEKPEYNTVDATLWSIIVLYEYHQKTNDFDFIKSHFEKISQIIKWHIKGTFFNIQVNDLGFLEAGTEKTQLTWMDAKIGNHVETPRNGCPVEINALWYNALCIYKKFSLALNTPINNEIEIIIKKIEQNFKPYFWNQKGYLNDVIKLNEQDSSIRPNQVWVTNLPFPLLTKKESKSIIKTCEEHLLTKFGLRTLSPLDKNFRPKYKGDQWNRDTAYHQGTTWPFLLSDFFDAYIKLNKHSPESKEQVHKWILPLKKHFYSDDCLFGISEVFDGLKPQKGKGCSNQAWSISGLIKVLIDHNIESYDSTLK